MRIPGQERIYSHRIEIIDNDAVPSILGVDFLKYVGATLQFTEHVHCDTATWSTPGHAAVTIPLHRTASKVTGSYAVTSAEGFVLRPGQEVKRCVAHIDIAPEKLRFNPSLYVTPTVVTVESNSNEADDDSLDLIPTMCVQHCLVSPELRQHDSNLIAMTTMSVKNNIASDMVISPGTRIGDIDIVTARDTPIFRVSREECCSDPRVQHELQDYVS